LFLARGFELQSLDLLLDVVHLAVQAVDVARRHARGPRREGPGGQGPQRRSIPRGAGHGYLAVMTRCATRFFAQQLSFSSLQRGRSSAFDTVLTRPPSMPSETR